MPDAAKTIQWALQWERPVWTDGEPSPNSGNVQPGRVSVWTQKNREPVSEEGHQPRQKGTRSLLWRCPSDALWQEAPGASMCPNRFSATSNFDSASPSYHGWPWSRQLETDPSLSAVRVARLSAGRLRCMRREPQPTGRSFAMRTQRGRPSQTNCFPHGAEGCRRRPPVT